MKPIRINMKYFGPFENETIDFKEMKDSMFLISGRTGSGKTMIFDAITYALYGTLSTADRQESSVRSQFAGDSDISSVTLDFEIRGKHYTIERTLTYRKEGRKTAVPPKVVLYDEQGEVVDSSISGVKSAVHDILQLNAEQFRQILILPQGEFKRLLTSSSEQKQEILRTLFRTERFVHFEMKLNELKKEKLKGTEIVETKVAELFNTLGGVQFEEIGALVGQDYPTFDRRLEAIGTIQSILHENRNGLSENLETVRKQTEQVTERLRHKEESNQRVRQLDEIISRLDRLSQQKEEIGRMERTIEEYRAVKSIEFELKTEARYLKEKEETETLLSGLDESLESLADRREQVDRHYRHLTRDEAAYEADEKWLHRTERFKDDAEIMDAESTIESLRQEEANLRHREAQLSRELEALEERLDGSTWSQKDSELLKDRRFGLQNEIENLGKMIAEEADSLEYDREKDALRNALVKLDEAHQGLKREYEEQSEKIRHRFTSADGEHIEHLIQHLKVGEPCPVCRQTVTTFPEEQVYISKAEEDVLQALDSEMDEVSRNREVHSRRIEVIDGILDARDRQDIEVLKRTLENKKRSMTALEDELEADRKKYEEKQSFEKKYRSLGNELNDSRLNINSIEYSRRQAESLLDEFKQVTEYQDYPAFRSAFMERESRLKAFRQEKKDCEDKLRKYDAEYSRMEEKRNLNRERLSSILQGLEETSPKVDAFISAHGRMDRSGLLDFIRNTSVEDLEEQVKAFHTQSEVLKGRKSDLEKTLEHRTVMDTSEERSEIEQLKHQENGLANEIAKLAAQMEHNSTVLGKIRRLAEEYAEELDELGSLIALVDAVTGRNAQKISLERYVLTYYLDRILHIANIRLLEMTNHRYELRRSTARSSRKTGLDIEVFDFYNNRSRHISSLSGGESFQAALTLALALNEALQQESGGISLGTMLVDEGFGTLDPETLDTAVGTLVELQTDGKMVGIISHVEELKERMENILEVRAVNERSTTHFK